MYNKLFTKILDSSIWLESTPTRIVWLTFIAVMDEKGFAPFAAIGNVAHRARVTLEEARSAITVLESPDPESSDPENEGRRLERVPGGWIVINAEKHRDLVTRAVRQAQTAERVRRFRERKRNSNAAVTTSEAYTEAVTEEEEVPRIDQQASLEVRDPNKESKNTARRRQQTPIIGKNLHLKHILCDDTLSYCVPEAVHHKLAGLLAPKHGGDHDRAAEALMSWYPTVWGKLVDGFVMGDAFKFWQTQFDGTFASAPTTSGRDEKAIVAHALASMRKDGTIGS